MPYTITCRHHAGGEESRHPQEWKDFDAAARQLAAFVEGLVTSLSSPLGEAEKTYVGVLVAEAGRTGVAVVPGLVSYHVTEVTEAPAPHLPTPADPPHLIDWTAVGRLARRVQRQAIDLNHTATIAPADDPDFDADGRARATFNELIELFVALDAHLRHKP